MRSRFHFSEETRFIFLTGMMASGKSTFGKKLARDLGWSFLDTDEQIEKDAQCTISDLWKREGEFGFRSREKNVLLSVLRQSQTKNASPLVVALGGGSLLPSSLRHAVIKQGLLVCLDEEQEVLAERLCRAIFLPSEGKVVKKSKQIDADILLKYSKRVTRPMLANMMVNLAKQAKWQEQNTSISFFEALCEWLKQIKESRQDGYMESHLMFRQVQGREEHFFSVVKKHLDRPLLRMPLGKRSYSIYFCHGAPTWLSSKLKKLKAPSHLMVSDENLVRVQAKYIETILSVLKPRSSLVTLKPGEKNKTISAVNAIWDGALDQKLSRDSLIVAFGGGVVGDVSGFAASTLFRGVPLVHVPTTLLSMVDSSLGGKTGCDLGDAKNAVGAMWQPKMVLLDLNLLTTLSERDYLSGFAEVVKVAVTLNDGLYTYLERHAEALKMRRNMDMLAFVIQQAVQTKIDVVAKDEWDTGSRALLNFGHSLGHALEVVGKYTRWTHGEAISLGMVLELEFAETSSFFIDKQRRITPKAKLSQRLSHLLARLGLPHITSKNVRSALGKELCRDKKRRGEHILFPVVLDIGKSQITKIPLDVIQKYFS